MKKTILFCGNGQSEKILPKVKTWGYDILLITDEEIEPGIIDSERVIVARTMDPDAALNAAKLFVKNGYVFHGVISLCWDCPISVAVIAHHFGLFGITVEVAKRSTYKNQRIEALERAGIRVPKHVCVKMSEALHHLGQNVEYPVVVKPVDLSGSTGVTYVESQECLRPAIDSLRKAALLSKFDLVLVEQFIDGQEISAEGLFVNGEFYLTGVSERVFDKNMRPDFVEVGDVMPTLLEQKTLGEIYSVCNDSAAALGIKDGIVKYDLIIFDNKVYVFEVTPRLGGPRFGTEMIPLSNGTNILRAAIQQAVGDAIDTSLLLPKSEKGMVAFTIFSKTDGIIKNISGIEDLTRVDGFYDFSWWRRQGFCEGDKVKKNRKLGYYIVSANSRNEALKRAKDVEALIDVEIV